MPGHSTDKPTHGSRVAYAHTLPAKPPTEWEPLNHLSEVGTLAGEFADAFGARAWGETLGHWHDIGKYYDAFEDYLLRTADTDASEGGAGEQRNIDSQPFVRAGLLEVVSAAGLELPRHVERVSSRTLRAGEIEALAFVLAHGDRLCTEDRVEIQAMGELGIGELQT